MSFCFLAWHNAAMKEQAHPASEFMKIDGESTAEGIYCIFTDDQEPKWGDLVVLENIQGKVFCTMESDPETLRKMGLKVFRVSRISYL